MILVHQAFHDLVRLFGHLLVHVFALLVVFIDEMSLRESLRKVTLHEQVHSLRTVLHTSRGINAGADLEDDIVHRDLASRQSADVHDGLQTHRRRSVQQFKSVVGEDAVFSQDGHDICGDAHGTELEQGDEPREGYAVVLGEGLHELETYATAAEMLEGVGGVLALRIEDRHRIRQFIIRHMMVADDEVDTQLFRIGNLSDGLDTAVEYDNEFDTFFCCIVHCLDTDTIALLITVGDIVFNIGIELLQKFIHQSYRRTSVDIVVAIDHDTLFAPHGVVQSVYRHVHVVHQERVYQLV